MSTHPIPDHGDQHPDLSRRGVLRGAALAGLGVPLVAACAADQDGGASGGGGGDTSGGATVATSDVPVGGGTVLTEAGVVVTQPTEGEFKAFSASCTHKGCPVTGVSGGEIICPCHGSRFSVEDGSVLGGPAGSPLKAKSVSVAGDQVTVS
jgi:Rieske Fe-S protein